MRAPFERSVLRALAAWAVLVAVAFVPAAIAADEPAPTAGDASAITGRWMVEKRDAIVEVERHGDRYVGTIVWAKDRDGIKGDERLDVKNPNPELRSRKVLGSPILTDLPATPHDGWYGKGRIYNPKTGKTYPVKLRLEAPDRLRLRVGGKIIGQTTRWTRSKS